MLIICTLARWCLTACAWQALHLDPPGTILRLPLEETASSDSPDAAMHTLPGPDESRNVVPEISCGCQFCSSPALLFRYNRC